MKALVLAGDYWHPMEVVKRGLLDPAYEGWEFDFVEDAKDILTPEFLKDYPLVIMCKGNNLTEANQTPWMEDEVTEASTEDFAAYVEAGGGLLVVHSGTTFGAHGAGPMADLVGCTFIRHPKRCDVEVSVLKDHPITAGVETFTVRDEHYEIRMNREDADLLLQSVPATGGTQIAGYAFTRGEGRIAALTPGHILSVWKHPEFIRLLKNAMAWCVKEA